MGGEHQRRQTSPVIARVTGGSIRSACLYVGTTVQQKPEGTEVTTSSPNERRLSRCAPRIHIHTPCQQALNDLTEPVFGGSLQRRLPVIIHCEGISASV